MADDSDDLSKLSDDELQTQFKQSQALQQMPDDELQKAYHESRTTRIAGVPVWTGEASDAFYSAAQPFGRILNAFGQGASTAWDQGQNLGFSDDINDAMKAAGVYPDVTKGQGGVMRAFNEGWMRPLVNSVAGAAGAVGRGFSTAVAGAQGAAAQAGEEAGVPQLGRDVAGLAEAFPDMHLPGAELRHPVGPLAVPEIEQANRLGVIGQGQNVYDELAPVRAPTNDNPDVATSSLSPAVKERVAKAQADAKAQAAEGAPASDQVAPEAPPPTPRDVARQIAPEVFQQYEPLEQRYTELSDQIADMKDQQIRAAEAQAPNAAEIADLQERMQDTTPRLAKKYAARLEQLTPDRDAFLSDDAKMAELKQDTPEIAQMRQQLMQIDYQMRDLSPQVGAAYREAMKQFPEMEPSGEPAADHPADPLPPAQVAENVAEQSRQTPTNPDTGLIAAPRIDTPAAINIRDDIMQKLQAAGRPAPEAEAAAAIVQDYYNTRAARLGGSRTAEQLYSDTGPDVRGADKGGPRGAASGKAVLKNGQTTITLFQKADASTFMHEIGHHWLEDLLTDSKDRNATSQVSADAAAVRKWVGADDGAKFTTKQHEKFARGFEQYLREGRAPSRSLDGVFSQFKDWLTNIYQTMKGLGAPISDDIRGVFDRMLSETPERTSIVPDTAAEAERTRYTAPKEEQSPYMKVSKEPERLTAFIRRQGGVRDESGEIKQILGGSYKYRPGLVSNTGMAMDQMARHASEHGFFPEMGDLEPLNSDFLRALEDDHRGQARYSMHDQDAVDSYRTALEHNDQIDELAARHGIDTKGVTTAEFFDKVAQKLSTDQQAEEQDRLNNEHLTAFDEFSAELRDYVQDSGETWDGDAFYGLGGPRTLEELERERGQENASGPKGQGGARAREPEFAGGSSQYGEEGAGYGGRGDRVSGRGEPPTARRPVTPVSDAIERVNAAKSAERDAKSDTGATARKPAGVSDADAELAGQAPGSPKPEGVNASPEPAEAGAGGQPASPHTPVEPAQQFVDKAGNIRLDNLNSPEDVKEVLRELAQQNADFVDTRDGVVSDAQRRSMADALGLDVDNFSPQKPEGVSPSVWAEAVQKLTFQAADTAARFAKVAGETGSPESLAAYLQAKQKLLMVADHFAGLTAEAGRTLRVFDKDGFKFAGDMVATMERDTGKTLWQLQQEAKAVGEMDTTAKQSKMIRDADNPTNWQKQRGAIISYFVNNLISGPITHMAYSAGNAVWATTKVLAFTPAEATIDMVRSGLGFEVHNRVYYGEVPQQLYGMIQGFTAGISPGWKAFKSGISYMEGESRLKENAEGNMLPGMGAGDQAFKGGAVSEGLQTLGVPEKPADWLGSAIETPSRAVSGIHTVFYSMNYTRQIAREAYRAASDEGLTGEAFATRLAQIQKDPPIDMVERAHNEALGAVLMKRPVYGGLQQKLTSTVNNNLALKLAMPFMQIGMNILDEGIVQSSPLGLASQAVRDNLSGKNGEIARTQQYARIMVGSGLVAAVMGLTAQGIMTDSGPAGEGTQSQNQRRLMEANGWRPNAIRIGDRYIPIRKYLGPLGPLVVAASNIYSVAHLMADGELSRAIGSATLGFSEAVASESWMQGLSNLIDAATHWDTDGDRYLRNLATDFIPFSTGMAQASRAIDPYQRDVHSWTAAFRNKIPGLSEGLYPRVDWAGRPIDSNKLGMLSAGTDPHDRAAQAMLNAQYYPAPQQRQIRHVPLTDKQYYDYSKLAGSIFKQRMDGLVNTPGFTTMPQGLQAKAYGEARTHSNQVAENMIMAQPGNENILRQSMAAKVAQRSGDSKEQVRAIQRGKADTR